MESINLINMSEKKYPIGGYAPGNYQCHCTTCGGGFIGDKRACQCEPCALNDRAKFDALSHSQQTELIKRNASIANYLFSGPLTPERDLICRIVEQWGNAVEMPNMEQWLKDYAAIQRKDTTYHSRFIQDYKEYKENLKYLGGPTEWTQEKVNSLNKVAIFETIKGFNELIGFLDSVLYAYEEGAQDLEERCLKAETQQGAVWVKASDRLPKEPDSYWGNVDGIKQELIFKSFGKFITILGEVLPNEKVQWLDESGSEAKKALEG